MFENYETSSQINTTGTRKRTRAEFEPSKNYCQKCLNRNLIERKRLKTSLKFEESHEETEQLICSHLMTSIAANADLVSVVAKQMAFHTEIEKYYTNDTTPHGINLLLRKDHLEIVSDEGRTTKLK